MADVFSTPGLFDYQPEPPTIHVYCFSKAADPTKDALEVRAGPGQGQKVGRG